MTPMTERRDRATDFSRSPGPAVPAVAPAALELRGLHKRFGPKVAVADLSLRVPAGSFYGLVGSNGAGKTRTLSMATGLLAPDAGQALVDGVDVWRDPVAVGVAVSLGWDRVVQARVLEQGWYAPIENLERLLLG